MATIEPQPEEGTFKDPAKEGEKTKSINQVTKNPVNIKKITKDIGKSKAVAPDPVPEPVDWKQAYFDLKEQMEATCLNLQLALRNNATKLVAKEKGLKTQEVPIG